LKAKRKRSKVFLGFDLVIFAAVVLPLGFLWYQMQKKGTVIDVFQQET
jgi:hypothetical protein